MRRWMVKSGRRPRDAGQVTGGSGRRRIRPREDQDAGGSGRGRIRTQEDQVTEGSGRRRIRPQEDQVSDMFFGHIKTAVPGSCKGLARR